MYLINIINYQTLCPNPYSRLGCGMILKSASAFEDDNDDDGSKPEKSKSALLMARNKRQNKMKCFRTRRVL